MLHAVNYYSVWEKGLLDSRYTAEITFYWVCRGGQVSILLTQKARTDRGVVDWNKGVEWTLRGQG